MYIFLIVLSLVVSGCAVDWLEQFVSKVICYVLSLILTPLTDTLFTAVSGVSETLMKVNLFEFYTVFTADVILAPRNVRIKRLSHTEMEITWDAPSAVGTAQIAGYVVHYTTHVTPDEIDRWPSVNTGPVTSVRIGQLEPHTVYAAAVCARSSDDRLGAFSDIAVDNHIGKLAVLSTCFICQ